MDLVINIVSDNGLEYQVVIQNSPTMVAVLTLLSKMEVPVSPSA